MYQPLFSLQIQAVLLTFQLFFGVFAWQPQTPSHLYQRSPVFHPKPRLLSNHNRSSDTRFLNSKTAQFVVKSLPDVPFDIGETYAGNIPISTSNTSRNLFFVFQPSVGPVVDEIVIWLNGGPGCSSLIGFFQENGRFLWQPGTGAPTMNPYSWVNLTNILWVDQPVGTGFSQGTPEYTNEEGLGEDFVKWFQNFADIFNTNRFKIFLTGESYAGRYVPYIAKAMIDKNDTKHLNLAGAMIVSGTIGSFNWVQEEVPTLPFVLTNNAILGLNASILARLAHLDKSCGYASFRRKYLRYPPRGIQPTKFFTFNDDNPCDVGWLTAKAAAAGNPCFNFYNILDRCPIKTNNLDAHNLGFTAPNQQVYFDRADVKAALHAPNIKWEQCTQTPIFLEDVDCFATAEQCTHDLSPDPIESVLPKVIEYTNRVLIANGALDTAIMSLGTLLSIQNMTWNGKLGFQKEPNTPVILTLPDLMYRDFTFHGLEDPSGTMGTQHFERGLMYTEVKGSGHMIPGDQPRSSYRHLQWLLGHTDTL